MHLSIPTTPDAADNGNSSTRSSSRDTGSTPDTSDSPTASRTPTPSDSSEPPANSSDRGDDDDDSTNGRPDRPVSSASRFRNHFLVAGLDAATPRRASTPPATAARSGSDPSTPPLSPSPSAASLSSLEAAARTTFIQTKPERASRGSSSSLAQPPVDRPASFVYQRGSAVMRYYGSTASIASSSGASSTTSAAAAAAAGGHYHYHRQVHTAGPAAGASMTSRSRSASGGSFERATSGTPHSSPALSENDPGAIARHRLSSPTGTASLSSRSPRPSLMLRSFVSHSSFAMPAADDDDDDDDESDDGDGDDEEAASKPKKVGGEMKAAKGERGVDRLRTAKNGRVFFVLLAFLTLAALSGTLTVYFIRYSTSTASTRQKPLDLTIKLDSRLRKSLYGLDYTPPFGGQYDQGCYITQQDVLEHVKLMSQLTTRIRLYGMDCLVADFTLNAVRLLNVNLSVVLTLWEDNDIAMITRQRKELYRVVAKYGGQNISYVSVGNEVLLRAADKGDQAVKFMGKEIDKTRAWLKDQGYGHIGVVTTDVADSWSTYPDILSHSDEAWGNVHPFFAGVLPTAGWDFAMKSLAAEGTGLAWLANKTGKSAMISEIGWPTAPVNESYQASVPTVENMNTFFNLWVCPANRAGIKYFWFEAFDCPWKEAYSIREASWGLFDSSLKLKDGVVIPQCD